MIKATKLSKSFLNKTIFKDLDFMVKKGEIKAIVGPSGKGKTTLLNVLSGLEKVEQGTIEINGRILVKDGEYVKLKEQKEILKDISVVFQNFNLFLNLNVLKNLEIVNKDSEKIDILLKRFGLYDKKNLGLGGLSGGEKQRLSIIRALIKNPKIIFFDEPTSALDVLNAKYVLNLILELKEEGYTIVVVTHDLKFVELLNCEVFSL